MTNRLSVAGFDLEFTFVGEWGASIYNGGGIFQSVNGNFEDNQTIDQLDRWQQPGDITDVPQARLLRRPMKERRSFTKAPKMEVD